MQRSEMDAIERVRRLVGLYEQRIITVSSLINDAADCVTPANIDQVLDLLPQDVRPRLLQWIRELPDPASKEIVVWPLPDGVVLSFKEWLRQQEADMPARSN